MPDLFSSRPPHARRKENMFVILLSYKKSLTEIDRFVAEHREFLSRYYASGHFLLSGRKEPRDGGVILAKADSRAEIELILRNDPFQREQIANYDIVEFVPTMSSPELDCIRVPAT
jgi:uncharacterized protein YciI